MAGVPQRIALAAGALTAETWVYRWSWWFTFKSAFQGRCRWQTGSRELETCESDRRDAFKRLGSGHSGAPRPITIGFGAAPPSASVYIAAVLDANRVHILQMDRG